MEQIVLIVHLLLALAIIGLIMLQQGKGADMGASFGAGASQTLLGSSGSGNVLTRATAWMVALFFGTSFGLAVLASQKVTTTDDLGITLPPAVEQVSEEPAAAQGDLPVIEEQEPAADLPAAAPAGDELPEL
jgi:preprotein translocase subunit SecG